MSAENEAEKVIDLDAIRALEAAVLPGPWEWGESRNGMGYGISAEGDPAEFVGSLWAKEAEFIAAARAAVPDLLVLLDEARGYLNWLNTSHDDAPDMRILRRAVADYLARFPTPSPTDEETT